MPKKSKTVTHEQRRARPSINPEAREQQLIALTIDLVEQQLRDGTASSQTISHFLKLSTVQHELELEKTRLENNLLEAKADEIKYRKEMEMGYDDVIHALAKYQGLDYEDIPYED